MKRGVTLLLLFVLTYALSLVALAPASFMADELEKRYPEISLYGVEGSVWSGSLRALEVNGNVVEKLNWSLSPFSLLLGNVKLDVDSLSSELQISGTVKVGLLDGAISLSEAQLRFPLAKYATQLGIGGFDLQGLMDMQLEQVEYSDGALSGLSGQILWRQAAIGSAVEMGDLQANIRQQEEVLSVDLSDQQGPISLSGNLSLQESGMYQLNTMMSARDNSDINLKQALRLLGRTVGENKFQVEKQGRVSLPAWFRLVPLASEAS